jgi:hypothetical protein
MGLQDGERNLNDGGDSREQCMAIPPQTEEKMES